MVSILTLDCVIYIVSPMGRFVVLFYYSFHMFVYMLVNAGIRTLVRKYEWNNFMTRTMTRM